MSSDIDQAKAPGRIYSYYVLSLLVVFYAFNFLDRQIITILAPSLKTDLNLSDAQIGLLFGTAFALFYALFGIPLAKLADGWNRVKTISLGLSLWSAMTAVSGFAGNFAQLGAARIGVGIGEASASPAAYSLIQDYFPKRQRATALAFYSSGIYVGVGASLIFGGAVIGYWDSNFTPETRPFGLAGWQATFLAFGVPGLLLALLVRFTVREPVRGLFDGIKSIKEAPNPFKDVGREMATMFPPFSIINLAKVKNDRSALRRNILVLGASIAFAILLVFWTDGLLAEGKKAPIGSIGGFTITTNVVQWTAMAIGVYCSFSWLQSIRNRDLPAAKLIGNKSFAMLSLVGGLASFASYGLSPFIFLYSSQTFGVGPESAITLGWILAISGGLGTIFGGALSDRAKKINASGRVYVVFFALGFSAIATYFQLTAENLTLFYVLLGASNFLQIMWLAPIAATTQDLVLPRMRGTAAAIFLLGTNIICLGMGPYVVGLISDVTGDLRFAMLSVLAMFPIILLLLILLIKRVPEMERTVLERARAAGEPV
jgi:MFS family permease